MKTKLTFDQRHEIRRLYASGEFTHRELAEMFRAGKGTIQRIVVAPEILRPPPKPAAKKPAPKPKAKPKSKPKAKPKSKPKAKTAKRERVVVQRLPPIPTVESPTPTASPIEFRRAKLEEIAADIGITRSRGAVNVLAGLHKLHLSVFDELVKVRQAEAEIGGDDLSAEEMVSTIVETITNLPPILRHQIQDYLSGIESGKIIKL